MQLFFNLLSESNATSGSSSGGWLIWVIFGVLMVALIIFNYFSRKKQQKAAEEKMAGLVPGSRIKTIGLICGTVISIDDVQNTVLIETGDGASVSYLTIDKQAIYQIFPEGSGVNGVNEVADDFGDNSSVEENVNENESAE